MSICERISEQDGALVIQLHCSLSNGGVGNGHELHDLFKSYVLSQKSIAVDMSDAIYIDSAAYAAILRFYDNSSKNNKYFAIVAPDKKFIDLLTMTKLKSVFKNRIFENFNELATSRSEYLFAKDLMLAKDIQRYTRGVL